LRKEYFTAKAPKEGKARTPRGRVVWRCRGVPLASWDFSFALVCRGLLHA
jgi:hypothetical protein